MSIVLTNDDGIDAPGIAALKRALSGHSTITVAPKHAMSGCGHQVSTYGVPIHIEQRAEDAYAIDGTPADCTRVALTHVYPEARYVIAGINAGGNMGADVYISGTVAAVREAAFHRVTGIAVSQYIGRDRKVDWDRAAAWTARVLDDLMQRETEPGTYWNVNLPHLAPGAPEPEIVECPTCTQSLPVAYRREGEHLHYEGDYANRERDPGSDVDHCLSGRIAVALLRL